MTIDVCQNIPLKSHLKAFKYSKTEIAQIFQQYGLTFKGFNSYNFAYGRQAVYTLLQRLAFPTVHFPAFICPTLVEAAIRAGKKVKFVDIKADSLLIDPAKIPDNCQCLFIAHTFGNIVDISKLRQQLPKAYIIEDCAHSLGSGDKRGQGSSASDAILYSFYKQIANFYGARLLVKEKLPFIYEKNSAHISLINWLTETEGWHQKMINRLRRGNIFAEYTSKISYKAQAINPITEKLFALGLKELHKNRQQRLAVKKLYDNYFQGIARYFQDRTHRETELYQYNLLLKPEYSKFRNKLILDLRKKGIFAGCLWYDAPVNETRFSNQRANCQQAVIASQSIINLPLNPGLKEGDIANLVNQIKDLLQAYVK